jgi:hypothetical protein
LALAPYPQPQLIIFENEIIAEFKREFKQMRDNYGIKAKPTAIHNRYNKANVIIERVQKYVNGQQYSQIIWLGNENNHENQFHLITSFNQLHGLLEAPIIQHYRQHHNNLCLAEIWSTILPSEQTGIKYKEKWTL